MGQFSDFRYSKSNCHYLVHKQSYTINMLFSAVQNLFVSGFKCTYASSIVMQNSDIHAGVTFLAGFIKGSKFNLALGSGWLSGYLSGLPPLRAGVQFWPRPACGLSFS